MTEIPEYPGSGYGRGHHAAAALLPDGRILVAGGEPPASIGSQTRVASKSSQTFRPPYLLKNNGQPIPEEWRPRLIDESEIPDVLGTGSFIDMPSLVPGDMSTSVTMASLIRPGSSTHHNDFDQRFIPLQFFWGTKRAFAPETAEEAPPGYYMLFFVNDDGRPSRGRFVKVWGIVQSSVTHSNLQVQGSSITITIDWKTNIAADVGDEIVFKSPSGTEVTISCSSSGSACNDGPYEHNATVTIGGCENGTWTYKVKSTEASGSTSQSLITSATSFTVSGCSGGGGPPHEIESSETAFLEITDRVLTASGTFINFGLTEAGPVQITVYDVAGRRVKVLVDETLGAGQHERRWDGSTESGRRVSAGVYLLKMTSPDGTLTTKAVAVR